MSVVRLTDEWTRGSMARAVPGAHWCDDEKAWVLPEPTPRSAAVALKMFPNLSAAHPELVELRAQALKDVRPFDNATPFGHAIEAGRVLAQLAGLGWKFFDYQAIDLGYVAAILKAHGGAYIGWERGLGKTLATCALIDSLDCERTLIVAPNTAKETVWAAELRRFCPWLDVFVLPNDKAKRERMLREVAKHPKPLVLVIHYEAMAIIAGSTGRGKALAEGWKKLGVWDLFVADEAHRLKNPEAKMSRAAKKVPAARRLALSGSIIENHLEELFSPLQWLFPDRYRSRWRDWNDRYLDYVENGYGRVCVGVQSHRITAMREELGVFMVYRRKEDELDLPERVEQTLFVELSPAQRKVYRQLQDECLARLDDGTAVKADVGLPMLAKLRQIATGLDLLSEKVADSAKLDLAVEMIADAEDDDFVVFSWYKGAVTALAERLAAKGIDSWIVTGDTPHKARADAIAAFQAGEKRVFIGTLSTLGESVNLQRANNAIFLDRSWNPGTNAQAADRIYRQGQQRKTTITHIIARDTVDELNVLPTLANKEALRAAILGGA